MPDAWTTLMPTERERNAYCAPLPNFAVRRPIARGPAIKDGKRDYSCDRYVG